VRSGRKRYSLSRSGRFAYLGVSLAGYVSQGRARSDVYSKLEY
jgi:hypothetical protein